MVRLGKISPNGKVEDLGIEVSFTFHNVGQGLFYSGEIGNFSFIYDCGVLVRAHNQTRIAHLQSIISDYVDNKRIDKNLNENIDLLVLSHLHEDHTSGLDALFKSGISVDTAILPYLTPIERLMVAIQTTDLADWFYDFLADPVTFLIEKGVKRVILMGGEEGSSPERPEERPEEDLDQGEKKVDYDQLPDDDELRNKVRKNDPQLRNYLDEKKLLVKGHHTNLKVMGIWVFRFFNYKLHDSQQKTFEVCIESKLGTRNLLSVIRSQSELEKIQFCYAILDGNFNNTSLVVYHGPTFYGGPIYANFPEDIMVRSGNFLFPYTWPSFGPSITDFGHFLTGDIDLSQKQKWKEMTTHFGIYFSRMVVVLVPHHGSKHNWNASLVQKVSPWALWVVSAGINQKHHPNFEIMKHLMQNRVIFFSNEFHSLSIY